MLLNGKGFMSLKLFCSISAGRFYFLEIQLMHKWIDGRTHPLTEKQARILKCVSWTSYHQVLRYLKNSGKKYVSPDQVKIF